MKLKKVQVYKLVLFLVMIQKSVFFIIKIAKKCNQIKLNGNI